VPPKLLSELIDAPASGRPGDSAYEFRSGVLTYGELRRQADSLAATLQRLGVQPGDRVGLPLHKSLRVPVAIYGVLRTGAVIVPMDPSAPPARHRFVIDDCAIKALIVDAKTQTILKEIQSPAAFRCAAIGVDTDVGDDASVNWEEAIALSRKPVQTPASSDDLAYVMYTSGSTGMPKGIMHTHTSGLAYARMSAALYDLSNDDRVGAHAPLHTDMSTFAYFSAPLRGAASVIVPDEVSIFPVQLANLIAETGITIWYSVPQMLVGLADRGDLATRPCPSLRWVLYGGEPIAVKHLSELATHWPHARIANVYGPAEVNQITHHEVTSADIEAGDVPIGTLCDEVHAQIVDSKSDRQPPPLVDPGEIGELVVRTPTMMHGYWNQPDRNALVFLDIAQAGGSSVRHFRTGDLVRKRHDGLLEFVGRKDRQVKLKGFRVELDGIEATLTSHPEVTETAAMVHKDDDGARLIVAIRPSANGLLDPAGLERSLAAFARSHLPRPAVPARFAVLEEFPRTGGKIDRRALLAQLMDAAR